MYGGKLRFLFATFVRYCEVNMKKILVFIAGLFAMVLLSACVSATPEYTVTFEANGGEGVATQVTVKVDEDYALPNVSKTGYKFYGWFDNANFIGEPVTTIPAGNEKDIKLYAKFSKVYTVTYLVDGGSHANVTSFTEEDNVVLSPAKKSGYVFLGWYTTPAREGENVEVLNQARDAILYAKYGTAYSIVYELNGGVNDKDNPEEFCAEQRVVLKAPTQNGMNFLGWYGSDNSRITAISLGTTEDVYLYAKWENAKYTITWDFAGGRSNATYPSQYTFGEGVSEECFAYPTKDNMVFAGWYAEKEGVETHVKNISGKDYGDLTIRAKWVNAEAVTLGARWEDKKTTGTANGNASYNAEAYTVTVPEELKNMLREGRLGVEIVGTFYANVQSQGDCTANAIVYLSVNGDEHLVCSATAKGGGYGVPGIPQNGSWGGSGNQAKSVKLNLTADEIKIGYRYAFTSDKKNTLVNISLHYGCVQLVCRFYIIG